MFFTTPVMMAPTWRRLSVSSRFDLALLLEEDAAGEHDVAALLVELDDLEVVRLADELVEVLDRTQIDLRAREERLDADVDGEAALDAGD